MKSNSKLLILLASLLALTSSVQAQTPRPGTAQYETVARLISQTQTYVQRAAGAMRQECYDNQVQSRGQQGDRSVVAPIIGGTLGALAGNSVGKGNGKTAAAVLGGVVGAVAADRMTNDGSNANSGYQTQKVCTMVQHPPVEVPSGYSITLSILDEGGEHRVVVQSQSPARPDQNGMVRMRVATALQY